MGLILLNKKAGITSFDALKDIKRTLGTGKVGHTGTLDKFAQGLLLVLTGNSLKLTPWFLHCDKQYIGRIRFGIETDTLDPEGETIAQAPLPLREDVEHVLSQFTGEILQAPPAYSAIHVNGKRASELARAGKAPQMKKRPVTVYKLELRSWEPPFTEIFVHCSSGTYIRCLARDIALAADSRGHLCELTRIKVAGFELEAANDGCVMRNIDKASFAFLGLQTIDISQEQASNIKHGKPLNLLVEEKAFKQQLCAARTFGSASLRENFYSLALFCENELVAVIERQGSKWKYGCVLT